MSNSAKRLLLFALTQVPASAPKGEQFYVNPGTGNDSNSGTGASPLKTINEAARRVNQNSKTGPTEIILTEGIHLLTETVLFNNNKYTRAERLLIRAEIMPDDEDWNPQRMPVVVTLVPLAAGYAGDEAIGIQTEVNHVTIMGIRFTGSPNYSYKNENELRRSYPIWRDGKDLDDLLVTQCMFAGNAEVMPLHVGVIANGQGLVVDHCTFFNCNNPVVFWETVKGAGKGNAMRYCIVYGSSFSAVWTTGGTSGGDFEFHHNVIANCKTVWVREKGINFKYNIHDCVITGNEHFAGFGVGPLGWFEPTPGDFLNLKNIKTEGTVQLETDQKKRNYLQLAEGSLGTELKAGLFKI